MDRIGTYEVLSLLAHDYGLYGVHARLNRIGLRVSPLRQTLSALDDWQQDLYTQLEPRAERTSATALYLAK